MKKPLIVIFLVLLLDQISKILVKTTMAIGEAIPVFGKWFYILFILASTLRVECGTARRRSLGMSLPVTRQMP